MRIPATLVRKPVIKKAWYDDDDPQCQFVYLMEREYIGWIVETQHSKEFLLSVIRHVCRTWKVPKPELRISNSKEKVYGRCGENYVWLNSNPDKPGNNLGTLIHELGHWVTDHVYGYGLEFHGPEFVYVYGKLLSQYKLLPFECYLMLCQKHNVNILQGE